MVVIVNYGLGNLRSVFGSVVKIGFDAKVSSKPEDIKEADQVILPGVGAFGDGIKNLKELGLVDVLNEAVLKDKKPILGICLGAQLMAKESFEFGQHQGLGWIDASVERMELTDKSLRVPHVGWNEMLQKKESELFEGISKDALFYYVHSYHLKCNNPEDVIGTCPYGIEFTAALQKDNIYATQFHPEKSQLNGLNLLKNFLTKTGKNAQKTTHHSSNI